MIYNYKKDNKNYRFNVSIDLEHLDKTDIIMFYKARAELKKRVKNFKLNSKEHVFIKAQIQNINNKLKEYAYAIYKVTIALGNKGMWYKYRELPSKAEIKNLFDEFINDLKSKRKNNKTILTNKVEYNGIIYELCGGVFQKPNSIITIQNTANSIDRIRRAKKPHPKIKDNFIGIELELICKLSLDQLEKKFIDAKLAGHVYIKGDSSIHPEDNGERGHEITILCKQSDYIDVIKRVCAVVNSSEVSAYVNNSCGMHVHFDARNRDANVMYTNLVRMLPILSKMVPATRVEGQHASNYCAVNISDDMTKSRHPTGREDRYQAINPTSYSRYKTIEVRLHSGTTNAAKIINWIAICLYAVDSSSIIDKVVDVNKFISMFNPSNKLVNYINKRIDTFSTQRKGCDTRADHFFNTTLDIAV